jgi:uncharacterized OsmC-like protein
MYQVEVSNHGTGEFTARAKESSITIHTTGIPFSPVDTLLASLGSCVGFFIRTYSDQAKLGLKDFSVRVESELSMEEKPLGLRRIQVEIDLKGFELDERRKTALLAFVKSCPIKGTLELRPEIILSLV